MSVVSPRSAPATDISGTFGKAEFALYVATVALWSTGWIGIKLQVGEVPVWQSVFYRFSIATVVMFIWVVLSGRQIRFPAALHVRFALMGALMFSTNFALFYYAAQWLTSGLLAVMFSLVTILNPINAAIFLRQRIERSVLLGALVGISGIALIFWPEVSRPESGTAALIGLAAAAIGTVFFSLGNIAAVGIQKQGLPVISTNAWGMLYGSILLALLLVAIGDPLTFDTRANYVVVLGVLSTVTTVLPMAAYLTLMRRIGPGRAGYATVMFPIGALVISWLFEGYEWSTIALIGLALALAGNLFVLGRPRGRRRLGD